MFRPSIRTARGITSVELLLILSVLFIFMAGAYSWIDGYSTRTKVAEALTVVQSAKTAIETSCAENPTMRELNSNLLGFELRPSVYVSGITLGGSCDAPKIQLVTLNTGLEPELTISVDGDRRSGGRAIEWVCRSDGLEKHVPKACRG
jgi:hypothetical protein